MSSKISGRIWTGKEYLYLGKPNGVTSIDFERREFIAKCYTSPFPFDKVTFERDTGLKDKNGKEIYEGDIVEYLAQMYPETVDTIRRDVVRWCDEQACFAFGGVGSENFLDYAGGELEVIGNVYENPELLEGEK